MIKDDDIDGVAGGGSGEDDDDDDDDNGGDGSGGDKISGFVKIMHGIFD